MMHWVRMRVMSGHYRSMSARPLQAALASSASFAVGAVIADAGCLYVTAGKSYYTCCRDFAVVY